MLIAVSVASGGSFLSSLGPGAGRPCADSPFLRVSARDEDGSVFSVERVFFSQGILRDVSPSSLEGRLLPFPRPRGQV